MTNSPPSRSSGEADDFSARKRLRGTTSIAGTEPRDSPHSDGLPLPHRSPAIRAVFNAVMRSRRDATSASLLSGSSLAVPRDVDRLDRRGTRSKRSLIAPSRHLWQFDESHDNGRESRRR